MWAHVGNCGTDDRFMSSGQAAGRRGRQSCLQPPRRRQVAAWQWGRHVLRLQLNDLADVLRPPCSRNSARTTGPVQSSGQEDNVAFHMAQALCPAPDMDSGTTRETSSRAVPALPRSLTDDITDRSVPQLPRAPTSQIPFMFIDEVKST